MGLLFSLKGAALVSCNVLTFTANQKSMLTVNFPLLYPKNLIILELSGCTAVLPKDTFFSIHLGI